MKKGKFFNFLRFLLLFVCGHPYNILVSNDFCPTSTTDSRSNKKTIFIIEF
jgi:hypothetical protein